MQLTVPLAPLVVQLVHGQYFLSPFPSTSQQMPLPSKQYRTIIPENTYIPTPLSDQVMHRQVTVNASAAEIFQVLGDVASYTDWTGYGVKSIILDTSSSPQFGSTLAHYESGLYGFVFLFALKWNFYYANNDKPYYAAFKLYQRTPLIEDIQGEYCVQPISNSSSHLSITVYAKMSRIIPGFIQNKLKHLIVEMALLDLKAFCDSSDKMKRFKLKPIPAHMVLPKEEIDIAGSLSQYPWLRYQKYLNSISKSMTDVFTFQESTITYQLLFYTFKFSQWALSCLDIFSIPVRVGTFQKKFVNETETFFRISEKALTLFDFHSGRNVSSFPQKSNITESSNNIMARLNEEISKSRNSLVLKSFGVRFHPKFRMR